MKRRVALSIVLLGGIFMMACGKNSNVDAEKDVVVYTTVTPGGQFPDTIEVTFDKIPSGQVNAEDFAMTGKASNWMDNSLHDFSASFKEAVVDGNTLTLTFDGFTDKYFFVDSWEVTNQANAQLSFSSKDISKVVTPVADDFVKYSKEDGEEFTYQLFTPEDTSVPQPIVVVFHGFADTHNLRVYRTSVAWAEPEAQAKRPCYVLSPIIDDNDYYNAGKRSEIFDKVYAKLESMISEGKVDPSRVYIMGNSFGGMSTIEFMEKYPDIAAAGIPLCSALNYSPSAKSGLEKITHIPLWIAQAENDGTIPSENSKYMYKTLTELGSTVVDMKIYSDEEMNAAGGSSDPNSTFSYHHVEMAVMEDEAYAEWLFSQHK